MPKVEENGMPSSLHYALTDSQCNKCGTQLEWKAEFNDINSPKYIAKHCNDDFMITIDTVKVEMVRQQAVDKGEGEGKFEHSPPNSRRKWKTETTPATATRATKGFYNGRYAEG